MLAFTSRKRCFFFSLAALAVLACGTKDPPRVSSGAGGDGGTGGMNVDAGEPIDGAPDSSVAESGGGGARPDAGEAGIIMVGPRPDSGPECVDGGRRAITKIDLLFMIDNSASMADKQAILAAAVPDLVGRLIDPVCVDPVTSAEVGMRGPDGKCAVGVPDFEAIKDIHIGVITSSLGGHGSTGVCDDPDPRKLLPHNDDKGHLVARTATDMPVATFQDKGFLNWNPTAGSGGAATPDQIVGPFQTMVTGVGQHGCGYEASLESVYRFLVDPDPYQTISVTPSNGLGVAVPTGTDMVLLQQRADFLRPDSLVAVIALTDENDCSIVDSGQGFYAIVPASGAPASSVLGHGTSACLTNPSDPCCYNCFQPQVAGCPDKAADPECQAGAWTREKDPENLRCWQQKRRYGVDFLYPVKRYVDGFKNTQVPDRMGRMVNNPLYSDLQCKDGMGCAPQRDRDLVFFAGVVGVPWQDVAVDPADLTKGYLTAAQLAERNVWSKILGDPGHPNGPVAPSDPHMIEAILPRPGLAGPTSAPTADPIHGHEWDISMNSPTPNADLQYACTFELSPVKVCTEATDCDCFVPAGGNAAAAKNSLCQERTTGAYSTTQSGAKAYPGLRQLEVLKGLGQQAIVGSICPANTRDKTKADYGYRPVIAAIVNRLRNPLRGCIQVN